MLAIRRILMTANDGAPINDPSHAGSVSACLKVMSFLNSPSQIPAVHDDQA
jgi:hypothetical protein